MTDKAKATPTWKSDGAREAFKELMMLANSEKERLLSELAANPHHSEYEKGVLKTQIARMYHEMMAGAYQTAARIDATALQLQAGIAATFNQA